MGSVWKGPGPIIAGSLVAFCGFLFRMQKAKADRGEMPTNRTKNYGYGGSSSNDHQARTKERDEDVAMKQCGP